MLLTKNEVNKRIEAFEKWLWENDFNHYMYRSIIKECVEYEVAKTQMEYRGVEELNVKITTEFYNSLKSI